MFLCFGDGRKSSFQFTVLPFGVSSASFIVTKLLNLLATHRRAQGIQIAIFFYDNVGASSSFEAAESNSCLFRADFFRCGFEINDEKSSSDPTMKFCWIGHTIDTHPGFVYAGDSRIKRLSSDLYGTCVQLKQSVFVHVRKIASVVGQIISMFGNVPKL